MATLRLRSGSKKMHAPKGRQAAAAGSDTEIEGVGTKLSGLATADNGPFRCGNCKWFTYGSPESSEGECGHPVVLVDPEVTDRLTLRQAQGDPERSRRVTGNGTVRVDEDECCNFFRPGGEKKSAEYEKSESKVPSRGSYPGTKQDTEGGWH